MQYTLEASMNMSAGLCLSFSLVFSPCLLLKPCENRTFLLRDHEQMRLGTDFLELEVEGFFLPVPWPQPTKRQVCPEQHTPAKGDEGLQAGAVGI